MSFTHNLLIGWSSGTDSIQKNQVKVSGAENNISETIAIAATDLLVAYELDVSQIQAFFMVSDTGVTVETNSATVPDRHLHAHGRRPRDLLRGHGDRGRGHLFGRHHGALRDQCLGGRRNARHPLSV